MTEEAELESATAAAAFMDATGLAKDTWPVLLSSNSLCSAIVKGKGDELVKFLAKTGLAEDTWPALLSSNSLCSAIVKGKGHVILQFLNSNEIGKDKWSAIFRNKNLSKIANGNGNDILHKLIQPSMSSAQKS